ncbi:HAD family hydrolase [Streptomyces sp. RTd22]|uniref:HAD family hydrolase n=1 Tax=Streptomyces sp. RTd22 TaxID=1841249 RepID=UPI0007C566CD|nr:HAD family hydrolase [Streptomyces sp. RTd22]
MTLSCAAVLFDLDGTLLDHDAASDAAVAATVLAQGDLPGVEPAQIVRWWRELETSAMDRYLAGEVTFQEQRRLRVTGLAERCGLGRWSDEQADAWFVRYLACYESEWRAYPDALPALRSLADRPERLQLGVVTNGDADQQRRKIARIGLADWLPHVTASSQAGAAKPEPAIFRSACADLGLPVERVVYVGDRLRTDAKAATEAGLRGVWLDRHGSRPSAAPTIPRIESLDELCSASLMANCWKTW